jgi:hypothetical protein
MPDLVVDSAVIDLGVIDRGGASAGVVRVTNRGRAAVRVTSASASCPCLTVAGLPAVIRPDETIPLTVRLDLAREPEFTGRLGVTMTVAADETPDPVLRLRADARVR